MFLIIIRNSPPHGAGKIAQQLRVSSALAKDPGSQNLHMGDSQSTAGDLMPLGPLGTCTLVYIPTRRYKELQILINNDGINL